MAKLTEKKEVRYYLELTGEELAMIKTAVKLRRYRLLAEQDRRRHLRRVDQPRDDESDSVIKRADQLLLDLDL